jgi:hypothetical protein
MMFLLGLASGVVLSVIVIVVLLYWLGIDMREE